MSTKQPAITPTTSLPLSKRELLLGFLATAVMLATPQSRLLAASQAHPVKLLLANGKALEIHKQRVFLLDGARRQRVRQGVFGLASGGRVEVRDGKVLAAAMGPGDAFVENDWTDWIEFGGDGGSQPRPGASRWLQNNGLSKSGR